jgi:hypothetical protein
MFQSILFVSSFSSREVTKSIQVEPSGAAFGRWHFMFIQLLSLYTLVYKVLGNYPPREISYRTTLLWKALHLKVRAGRFPRVTARRGFALKNAVRTDIFRSNNLYSCNQEEQNTTVAEWKWWGEAPSCETTSRMTKTTVGLSFDITLVHYRTVQDEIWLGCNDSTPPRDAVWESW